MERLWEDGRRWWHPEGVGHSAPLKGEVSPPCEQGLRQGQGLTPGSSLAADPGSPRASAGAALRGLVSISLLKCLWVPGAWLQGMLKKRPLSQQGIAKLLAFQPGLSPVIGSGGARAAPLGLRSLWPGGKRAAIPNSNTWLFSVPQPPVHGAGSLCPVPTEMVPVPLLPPPVWDLRSLPPPLALLCQSQEKHDGHTPFNPRQHLLVHAGAPGSRRTCASPALQVLCWEQWDPQPHGQLSAPQHWEWWMLGMGGGS